ALAWGVGVLAVIAVIGFGVARVTSSSGHSTGAGLSVPARSSGDPIASTRAPTTTAKHGSTPAPGSTPASNARTTTTVPADPLDPSGGTLPPLDTIPRFVPTTTPP